MKGVESLACRASLWRLVYALPQPGLVMAPNWMGIGEGAERIAKEVAEQGYVVLIADLYGQSVRPSNADEAGAAMMPLKNDRAELRKRMQEALAQLLGQSRPCWSRARWPPSASASVVAVRWSWRVPVPT
jgi:dienelactone hydrolase